GSSCTSRSSTPSMARRSSRFPRVERSGSRRSERSYKGGATATGRVRPAARARPPSRDVCARLVHPLLVAPLIRTCRCILTKPCRSARLLPMLTLQAIEEKLRARGWDPEPAEAEGTLHATHPTAEGSFPFYFRLSEDWLILSIVPFMRVDGRPSLELSR